LTTGLEELSPGTLAATPRMTSPRRCSRSAQTMVSARCWRASSLPFNPSLPPAPRALTRTSTGWRSAGRARVAVLLTLPPPPNAPVVPGDRARSLDEGRAGVKLAPPPGDAIVNSATAGWPTGDEHIGLLVADEPCCGCGFAAFSLSRSSMRLSARPLLARADPDPPRPEFGRRFAARAEAAFAPPGSSVLSMPPTGGAGLQSVSTSSPHSELTMLFPSRRRERST
jgi:hypothetical protein